ncbi:hypothetical protein ACFQ6N_33780 [Kitasatospora sp. NPDC056446]|uniref:hypothetical protein n=1 Tax=Kitasatospora sp. NPDC056446 TaxID=3345819 RepID=UPI003697F593
MTLRHARRLGGATAAAIAAGLLTTPTAAVADTGPAVLGTAQGATYQTAACDSTADPTWIGLSVNGPTLSAKVTGEAVKFGVWDVTTGAEDPVFTGQAQTYGQPSAGLTVPGLVDGHSYAWHAWALQGTQTSAQSADCHFTVDTTSPTVTVSSTDFPTSGTATKYAGQKGTFVLKGADPVPAGGEASGVACFQYGWTYAGSDCNSPGAVEPDADGAAKIDLKALGWGTNNLVVNVIDNAGNVGRTTYTFYAPSNPNPPKTLGDVDGDGVADILLPDAQGNLQFVAVNAPDATPATTIAANRSPRDGSWAQLQVAHRGWSKSHAPSSDDIFVHKPGDGYLYLYRNFDYGSFTQGWSGARRSTRCVDDAGAAASCPADYASDWSKADQVVAFGPVTDATSPSLLTLENGDLWLHAGGEFTFGLQKVRKLTTSGTWSGYDLVAPGPDAAGNLALWARDRATGELHAYPIPKKADGTFDFSALADPKADVVASGFTVAAYPTLGSSGDADGDGKPDLWAVTADRHLVMYSGWTDADDLGPLN